MTTQTWDVEVPPITVGMRIKIAREWRGMEQHDLAEATGISRSTVSNYESGATTRLKPLYLQQIALALGVPVSWLQTGIVPSGGDSGSALDRRYALDDVVVRSGRFRPEAPPTGAAA